jgi:hypothetical protein
MKKMLCFLLIILFVPKIIAQTIFEEENLIIELVKARKIGVLSVQFAGSGMIQSGPDDKRVQLRLKVRSLNKEFTLLDPNKLSLTNDANKIRFSVSQVQFATFFRSKGFTRLTTSYTEENKTYAVKYDPSVKNTFDDFSQEGYKDAPICLNFGTKKRPDVHTIYFKPNTIDKNVLDVYFVVPNEMKTGKVYYGDTFISDIKIR